MKLVENLCDIFNKEYVMAAYWRQNNAKVTKKNQRKTPGAENFPKITCKY
jgi:hypothetical protein